MHIKEAKRMGLSRYTADRDCRWCGSRNRCLSPTGYSDCEDCKKSLSCAVISVSEKKHNDQARKKLYGVKW